MISFPFLYTAVHLYVFLYHKFKFESNYTNGHFLYASSNSGKFNLQHVRLSHDDVTKWKHFPRYWLFVRGIHQSPVNSPHTAQWCGAFMFSLICLNGWVNNGEADVLRRHRAQYYVTVMSVGDLSYSFGVCIFIFWIATVYPKKYAHGFVVLCFVVVMQSFIMNSHEVVIHIHQGCFAGTGAIGRLPQCQWSKPDGYGNSSQCITTTKHSKAKTVCIFLGIYCSDHIEYGIYPGSKLYK